jgi:glycerophosphoryl diester phosphodiesterase
LLALDAGYYWTNDDGQSYPFRGQGITIPTLEEVFTTFPQTPMVIEVKQQEPAIVRPFCQMLRDYDMADKVLMGTFHEAVMTDFRATCPEVATSLVQSEITPFWALNQIGLGGLVQLPGEALQVPLTAELPVLGEVDVVTERFVAAAADQNVDVQPWTIDDPEEMARLLDLGVQGIITDRPDVMVALLAERP